MLLSADALNADCACVSLDREALCKALTAEVGDDEFCRALAQTHPNLISTLPVFVRPAHLDEMQRVITAIEQVAKLPAYRAAALAHAPEIARVEPGAIGVLMGYDFHLGPDGPRLIEINTNAGGMLVNAFIARAQKACCDAMSSLFPVQDAGGSALARLVEIFREDFARQRGAGARLARIAIVDDEPQQQYLYPEFVLFRALFRHHEIEAVVTAPEALQHRGGGLWHDGERIDLVYNRLTDFALDETRHAALRSAYIARDVVVTPNPWAHALYADKRNLVRLSDTATLRTWGVDEPTAQLLANAIPHTILVEPRDAERLWKDRARYFFKPATGYGGKAAYRGDKITRRVWEAILAGGYVAQEFAAPGSRVVVVDGERRELKVDVRNYTYDGRVLLSAARLYQGQTTNFRTPGGGFAPVLAGIG